MFLDICSFCWGDTARRSSAGEGEGGGRQSGRRPDAQRARISGRLGKSWELWEEHLGVARLFLCMRKALKWEVSGGRSGLGGLSGLVPLWRGPGGGVVRGPERVFSHGASVRVGGRLEEPCTGAWPLWPDRPAACGAPVSGADPALEALGQVSGTAGGGEAQQSFSPNLICRFE